jgi:REP element-mobilizing transposase RayT
MDCVFIIAKYVALQITNFAAFLFSIYICKYRKKLLVGQLKDDMRSFLLNITSNSDFQIEVFESDLDHIHFLIRYIPRVSITSIVRKLKQESTYYISRSPHRSFLFEYSGPYYTTIPQQSCSE